MLLDRGILRRGATIAVVAPLVVFMLLDNTLHVILVWLLTFVGMLEWTAMKRHLKVALLMGAHYKIVDLNKVEYPVPVARTNVFIFVKCLACSALTLAACYGYSWFSFGMMLYFMFWVLFTLMGQNRAEIVAERAKTIIGSPSAPSPVLSPSFFHNLELAMIAEYWATELFLSFCLEYFGFVWVTGLSHALLMLQIPVYGRTLVVVTLVANWANDIAALIVGRALKGHTRPLYPRISPNKSLEGAVAGVISNAVVPVVLMELWGNDLDFLGYPRTPLFFSLGLLMGVLGVIGDLLQSLFKRTARLKDTGSIFPGHGGVLDRIDGLLIVLPAAYWILYIFMQVKDRSTGAIP
jgi:CDP-diglyceride synthetase